MVTITDQGLSYIQYETDGVEDNFVVTFPYLSQTHIHIYLDGVESLAFTWINSSEIQMNSVPASGVLLTVKRLTEQSERLVNFQDGGVIREATLDLDSNQLFYLTQEAIDTTAFNLAIDSTTSIIDAQNNKIINVTDGVDPQDAVTKAQLDIVAANTAAGAQATADQAILDAAAAQAAADAAQADATQALADAAAAQADATQALADAATAQATAADAHINDTTDAHDASAISNIPSGNLAATDQQGVNNELQSDIDLRVTGPASSTNNAVAVYNGITGKIVKNSVFTVDPSGIAAGLTGITTSGDLISNGITKNNGHIENLFSNDAATTGSGASIAASTTPVVRLTNASLVSVSMITSPVANEIRTFINATGVNLTVTDDTGGTAANRIKTGTKASVTWLDEATMTVMYDATEQRWMLIGAMASGSGTNTVNIATKTSNYTITSVDDIILVDATSGSFNITLPSAIGLSGKQFTIKRLDSTFTNTVSIVGTIDGVSTRKLHTVGETWKIASDGTIYTTIDHYTGTGWTAFPSVAYGTLITTTGTAASYGTVVNNNAYWRRVGENVEVRWDYRQSTTGTAGTGNILFNVPSYLAASSQVIVNTSVGSTVGAGSDSASVGSFSSAYSTLILVTGRMNAYSTTQFKGWMVNGTLNDIWGAAGYHFGNNATLTYAIQMSYPVSGWAA